MSPPLLGVGKEEAQSNVTLLASSASMESICQNGSELKERNYMGLSECSSVDTSTISTSSEDNSLNLNFKATELRLGLPGSQSPKRDLDLCLLISAKLDEKPLFPLHPSKAVVSGSKRGFADTMDAFSEGKFHANSEANVMLSPRPASNLGVKLVSVKENLGVSSAKMKEVMAHNTVHESPHAANETSPKHSRAAPATKAQVVGWPPIRSFRKNSLATNSKNVNEEDGKAGPGALLVKVSMDGAPYLRKVDLRTYPVYQELSFALEKMFSCFTIGQYGSHGAPGREMLSESKLKDLLHGSEYVLTYEDRDGDWMLVGDVPWEMFVNTCKKLRIMKSSDAIGLAPRATEKNRNRS